MHRSNDLHFRRVTVAVGGVIGVCIGEFRDGRVLEVSGHVAVGVVDDCACGGGTEGVDGVGGVGGGIGDVEE